MTPLTLREQSAEIAANIISLAQEASVSGSIDPKTAFAVIIPEAQELQDKSVNTGNIRSGSNNSNEGGKATFTKSLYKIKPSLSDFIVDVELAAKRSLTQDEFEYFKDTYFTQYLPIADMQDSLDKTPEGHDKYFAKFLEGFHPSEHELVIQYDKNVREKVGAAFIERGIYPFSFYMNHADQDVRKRFEK